MMTAQYSDHFCLSLPEQTACCHEDSLQARVTSSEAIAADIVANDKRFNYFVTANKATPHRNDVPKHKQHQKNWANKKLLTNKNLFSSEGERASLT